MKSFVEYFLIFNFDVKFSEVNVIAANNFLYCCSLSAILAEANKRFQSKILFYLCIFSILIVIGFHGPFFSLVNDSLIGIVFGAHVLHSL